MGRFRSWGQHYLILKDYDPTVGGGLVGDRYHISSLIKHGFHDVKERDIQNLTLDSPSASWDCPFSLAHDNNDACNARQSLLK